MSDLLVTALKARIPIVRITSDDPDHLMDLIDDFADREVLGTNPRMRSSDTWAAPAIYVDFAGLLNPSDLNYDQMLEEEISVVIVNADPGDWKNAMDCGRVVPSLAYIKEQLHGLLPDDAVEKYLRYFAGMTLKDTVETILITQARDRGITATGLNETKAYLGAGLEGLEAVDADQELYIPPQWAKDWLAVDAKLFGHEEYQDLWPRGFMLHGPSGTGKTGLSRYIAKQLKWPLYRLDLGSLYSKYQGESERNLRKVLSFMSTQGEAVFLLDEAEKLFGNDAVGQASLSTLLSMLLWWLQGETNRTVTVMTSNDLSVIPPELYRPGRLDAVHELTGLQGEALEKFMLKICQRTAKKFGLKPTDLLNLVNQSYVEAEQPISQASIVALIRAAAKKAIVEKGV